MRRLFACCAIALVAVVNSAWAEAPVVRRSTLLVADIAASIRFYEALGFTRWYDQAGPRDPSRPTTLPLSVIPAASRLVIMKGREPWVGMVGLLAYDQPKPPNNRIVADKIGLGDVILMIELPDVKTVHENLVAIGARVLQPPKPFEVKGATGAIQRGINCFAVDPDGHVVELSQQPSGG